MPVLMRLISIKELPILSEHSNSMILLLTDKESTMLMADMIGYVEQSFLELSPRASISSPPIEDGLSSQISINAASAAIVLMDAAY